MDSFEFSTTRRIIFGNGSLDRLPGLLSEYGQRPLLIVGFNQWKESRIFQFITSSWGAIEITDEPTVEKIRDIVQDVKDNPPDVIIGFGGGSALDTAKAVAALLTNPGDVTDYLETIGKGEEIKYLPLPVIAIPTTAGTGSEVTSNSVLGSPEHKVKVSLRSRMLFPAVALVDPETHLSISPEVTAATGLDALTQVIEPFVSLRANPITDGYCRDGIKLVRSGLLQAFGDGSDIDARWAMALASLYGGLALSNAKLGAVHGIAGPFGGMYKSPHGAVCGKLLPMVMKTNLNALRSRDPENPVIERYRQIAVLLTGIPAASAEDGYQIVAEWVNLTKIPGLSTYGFTQADFPALISAARDASSMKGNPMKLQTNELEAILMESM